MSSRGRTPIAATAVLWILAGAGCSQGPEAAGMEASRDLHELFARYERSYFDHSPEEAAFFRGDESRSDRLNDISLGAVEAEHADQVAMLRDLEAIDRTLLSAPDSRYFDLFERHLQRQIELYEFEGYLRPVSQRPNSVHLLLATHDTFYTFDTEADYRSYLSRIAQIPETVDATIERMALGLEKGITYPREATHAVEGQLASLLVEDPSASTLYRPFRSMPDSIDEATRGALAAEARRIISEKVVPAFAKLHRYWVEQYYPRSADSIALSDLPRGAEWYRMLLAHYTSTDLTADQIHEIGLEEVARIRKEMLDVIAEVGFDGSFEEFVHFLRTDPRFYFSTPDDLLTAYRARAKRIDPEVVKVIGKLPRLPYGVRSITAAESSGQAGYCDLGSLAQGRPSYLAMTTSNLEAIKTYQMDALILHEMVPGHHLQMSLVLEEEDQPFFRNLDYDLYHAYTEGWALYAEGLGEEMGVYADSYSRFGRLDLDMLRAIRLVVDTGIHTQGWSREKAVAFFLENSSLDEEFVRTEVDRYIVYPGQAVSYKVGEMEFWRLRRMAERELGEDFDVRELHDEMLAGGPRPLTMLASDIQHYVARKKT